MVAGEGWHEGVIGIVASRLVERYNRPVVLITGTEGAWKGSGRSVAAFDLHAGLAACADELERFGGHRAAAGLTIERERVETFARAFAAHAAIRHFPAQEGADDAADHRPANRAVVARGLALLLIGHVFVVIAAVLLRGGRLLGDAPEREGDGGRGDESLTSHDRLLCLAREGSKFRLNGA